MMSTFVTLVRGRSHDAAQALADANALSILRQQVRDAAAGVEGARKAVALVMAYADRERRTLPRLAAQLEELEVRALAALGQGREDLATEAAAAIAGLEGERAATEKALAVYETRIATLREELEQAETRLRDLQRGAQLADATWKSQGARGVTRHPIAATLAEAEATLDRLQSRQTAAEVAATALMDLTTAGSADAVAARLAAAGCGPSLKPDAAAVLMRLKARTN
jgi:phage shock protein A